MAKDDELFVADTVSGDATTSGGMTANEIGALDAIVYPLLRMHEEPINMPRMDGLEATRIIRRKSPDCSVGVWPEGVDLGSSLGNILAGVKDLNRICARVIADGAPHRIETRDGDRRFVLRIAPYTGSDRQILGAVLTFTNVTAFRASIEQAIYEREYMAVTINS